jgi:adenylosuccinate synthase
MSLEVIIGTQWGDEGKGRVVDLLSEKAHLVARYNGGDNAGHTVTVGEKIFKLHLIPSGIVHPHVIGVLGNGMVLNPFTLLEEMEMLRSAGVDITPDRVWISDAAHLITPAHRLIDRAQDEALGKGQIGTTGRGIGPAYTDKAARRGIRTGEVLDPAAFEVRVRQHFENASNLLQTLYKQPALDVEDMTQKFLAAVREIAPYIRCIRPLVRQALAEGKTVLAEGAQGTLLDLDQGTYPFVTSSCTTATGLFSGLGLGICPVERVLGVTKAFQTRVGAGPFPTELSGDMAGFLRGTGANPWDEYGTTTGRPRRVGWLDAVLLRYAIEINGVTELFVTKLDTLSGLDTIRVCTAYELDGQKITSLNFSGEARMLERCRPVYESVPGWKENLRGIRLWDDLPRQALDYIRQIETWSGVPVNIVSVGPERSATVFRQ